VASGPRDLILGAVDSYNWEAVRPFVESLRSTGYDGELRFFVSNVSDETAARLRDEGVELTRPRRVQLRVRGKKWSPYNWKTNRLRWYSQPLYGKAVRALAALSPDPRLTKARLGGALGNLAIARYFWYFDYLSRTVGSYRNVMVTDVRDVVFTGNPFDFDIGSSVHMFLENEEDTIGSHPPSKSWLVGAYGHETFDALSDRPIVCSGVTIGAAPAVLAYLGVMVDELARLDRQFDGMDQGIHNYLLYNDLVPDVRFSGNEDGPVVTLALIPPERAISLVYDRDPPPKVVHQYDRHPRLVAELARPADA
jgi:hypothetical protein